MQKSLKFFNLRFYRFMLASVDLQCQSTHCLYTGASNDRYRLFQFDHRSQFAEPRQ